jgi:hypothetical protein
LQVIRKQGYEALAIPHNMNASNGLMFDWVGQPHRSVLMRSCARLMRPLAAISQDKGNFERLPAFSPNDESANFGLYDHLLTSPTAKSKLQGSYVRDALGRGRWGVRRDSPSRRRAVAPRHAISAHAAVRIVTQLGSAAGALANSTQ